MQPPAGVDMNLIREALARRAGGGAPMAGGGTPPAVQQQTAPGGSLPTGGPNVPQGTAPQPLPTPNPTQGPNTTPRQMPASSANPQQQVAKLTGQAMGFPDPETRDMAKTLLAKLVQFL